MLKKARSRGWFLTSLLLALCSPTKATELLRFQVYLGDKPIGQHSFRITENGATIFSERNPARRRGKRQGVRELRRKLGPDRNDPDKTELVEIDRPANSVRQEAGKRKLNFPPFGPWTRAAAVGLPGSLNVGGLKENVAGLTPSSNYQSNPLILPCVKSTL